MKIATWNVNSLKVRLPHVLDWLSTHEPDVLALQETKLTDDKFPVDELREAGYDVVFTGQKTYNGVALISRGPADDVFLGIPELDEGGKRIIAGTFGNVRVLNLYVVNGQEVGAEKYHYKLDWLKRVTEWVQEDMAKHDHFVVVGDFNIAPAAEDIHDPEAWHEKILCSTPERERLETLLGLGFYDAFRSFPQEEASFSWWDYRQGGFRRNRGLRIDLILASESLRAACQSCVVDTAPRKLERPSDHAPVVADFLLG